MNLDKFLSEFQKRHLKYNIILHQKSSEDIEMDKDEERKQITLSKFKPYNLLEEYPEPSKDSQLLR